MPAVHTPGRQLPHFAPPEPQSVLPFPVSRDRAVAASRAGGAVAQAYAARAMLPVTAGRLTAAHTGPRRGAGVGRDAAVLALRAGSAAVARRCRGHAARTRATSRAGAGVAHAGAPAADLPRTAGPVGTASAEASRAVVGRRRIASHAHGRVGRTGPGTTTYCRCCRSSTRAGKTGVADARATRAVLSRRALRVQAAPAGARGRAVVGLGRVAPGAGLAVDAAGGHSRGVAGPPAQHPVGQLAGVQPVHTLPTQF